MSLLPNEIQLDATVLELAGPGRTALPTPLYEQITAAMRFKRVSFEMKGVSGGLGMTRTSELRRIYEVDQVGRVLCPVGFLERAVRVLTVDGVPPRVFDLVDRDPAVLAPNWANLGGVPQFAWRPEDAIAMRARLADPAAPLDVATARRALQHEIFVAIERRVALGYSCTVQAACGVGKSVVMTGLPLLLPHARFAFVVPGSDLVQKTVRAFLEIFPEVGRIGCGTPTPGALAGRQRILVVSRDSLHKCPERDVIVGDEIHAFATETHSEKVAFSSRGAVRIGFTANATGRADGSDPRIEAMFGAVCRTVTWPRAERLGLVVPVRVRWIHVPKDPSIPSGAKLSFMQRKKSLVWNNAFRNARIAAVAESRDADEQVLIIVETVEHALRLGVLLPDFALVHGHVEAAACRKFERRGLGGGDDWPLSPKRREELRIAFESGTLRKVIATYVWAQGVSFDNLSVLIRADARASAIYDEQIPGRTSRPDAHGKCEGVVYDCNDDFDENLRRAARQRARNYREKRWRQAPA